ncbi:divalent-cation tolerance protein CutA [Polymorphum gilvum]|uniref:Strongly divalent cation tolerance protein n=1 Tax=Polymorphum gilvum (strain LMG 25793 / CGMCC 1.9160 / SL003B-26A1) TaxID=991905 RepID=F2J467_POLGS|nr:divalent-cation tolerance protein CutA [Polymorphum gilvum]ADZ69993.1 Strongly divalent cation tolerance protein [Polymorphum gilvum SL003B-26A1]
MPIAVCTTTATREEARAIARACVEAGLVACAHLDEIDSLYVWDGKLAEDREIRVMLKAADAAWPRIEALIRAMHSYEEPAIYVFPITAGSASYLSWIEARSAG